MDIEWNLKPEQIEWTLEEYTNHEGKHRPEEQIFEKELAIAHMLMNEVIFMNSWYHRDDIPEDMKKMPKLIVNCNDVFAWACADGEELPWGEVETLYKMWTKDPYWGPAIWCIIQRKEMPQKPLEDMIRKAGIWDLDTLNLEDNTMDAWVHEQLCIAAHQINKKKREEKNDE